jgi:hypothetical protein
MKKEIINRMLARVIRDGIESTDGAGNPMWYYVKALETSIKDSR